MFWKRAILMALAACFSGCRENPVSKGNDDPQCDIDFEEAQADPLKRDAFFSSLGECNPVVRQARDSGKVLKVLYAPDSARIRKELTASYHALGYSQADISVLADVTISGSMETDGMAMAQISSTTFGFYAAKLPVFILAFEKLFSWQPGINRYDMETILLHELQHAGDWYDGMRVGNLAIGNQEVAGGSAGAAWTVQLMELRAVYRELDAAYEPKARVDSFHISYPWFASRAASYAIHWRKLDSLARSGLEIAAVAAQKQEFRGIVPEIKGDSLLLRFDRYGRSLAAVFEAVPPRKQSGEAVSGSVHVFKNWKRRNG